MRLDTTIYMLKIVVSILFLFLLGGEINAQTPPKSGLDTAKILQDFSGKGFDPFVNYTVVNPATLPKTFQHCSDFSLLVESPHAAPMYGVIDDMLLGHITNDNTSIRGTAWIGGVDDNGDNNYEQIKITYLTRQQLSFECRDVDKVLYKFTGKFLRGGKLMRFNNGENTSVLAGVLTRRKKGRLVGKAKIRYTVNVAYG